MTTTTIARPASDRQLAFIERLAAERSIDLADLPDFDALDIRSASDLIDTLMARPRQTSEAPRGGKPEARPGVYRKNGRIYVVRPSRQTAKLPEDQQRCYAMELVELPGRATRLTEAGTEIPFTLEIRKGFVYDLTEADRMPGRTLSS